MAVADLKRPVLPLLLQSDASPKGFGVVYTEDVNENELKKEARRPRGTSRAAEEDFNTHMKSEITKPESISSWKIAVRARNSRTKASINDLELEAIVRAVKWTLRNTQHFNSRIILEADSLVAVGVVRKGRSSVYGLLKHARRLAALLCASGVMLIMRHVESESNFADGPSRGRLRPGGCIK